jgi:hypothetical protein
MARTFRLSALVVWSIALLPIGLAGCDLGQESSGQMQVEEVAHNRAVEKMRDVMQKQKGRQNPAGKR